MDRLTRVIHSLGLAASIVVGSVRLLARYPVLVLPLLPVFVMVVAVEFGLLFLGNLLVQLLLIFVVAFELMFSFVITSHMIHQIHEGRKPSLLDALTSSRTLQLIPNILLLSAIWYSLILVLVAIEVAINAFLDREGGEGITSSIFGTIADALRMMGFILIPIMIFESTGLRDAFGRLRSILNESPITALGGLVLTKMMAILILLIVEGISQLGIPLGLAGFIFMFVTVGLGWTLAMYLEQIFVTGLYLYAAHPESEVVGILLEKQLGNQLPEIPSADQAAGQPAAQ